MIKIRIGILCTMFMALMCLSLEAQTDSLFSEKKKVTGSFLWEKLSFERVEKNDCEDNKTMVFIYSEVSNFALMDGSEIVTPSSSISVAANVKKHIFCLKHPSPEFVIQSFGMEDVINIASFAVGQTEEQLTRVVTIAKQKQESSIKNSQITSPSVDTNKLAAVKSVNPIPVSSVLSWKKIGYQKEEENLCTDSAKTTVYVYSEHSKIAIMDGEKQVLPVKSSPFVENILQNVYCLEHPTPYFSPLASVNNSELKNPSVFLASKNADKMQDMELLIKQKLVEKLLLISEESLTQNKNSYTTEESGTTKTLSKENENTYYSGENKKQDATHYTEDSGIQKTGGYSHIVKPEVLDRSKSSLYKEELASKEFPNGDYGYKIQLMAKLKDDYTESSIKKYFNIPYDIQIDYDGTWHRFLVGYFQKYEDARGALKEILERYHVKEGFVSLYTREGSRVCIFME